MRKVYCHFSFKRPKDRPGIAYFAVVFFEEAKAKNKIARRTVERELWLDQQFVTAIQSYEYALEFIHEWQGVMLSKGIKVVRLVTDNSVLAGWIKDPKKNKEYTEYMNRAVRNYRKGGAKELAIDIELCKVANINRAYYYCTERHVENGYRISDKGDNKVKASDGVSVFDIIDSDINEPKINL